MLLLLPLSVSDGNKSNFVRIAATRRWLHSRAAVSSQPAASWRLPTMIRPPLVMLAAAPPRQRPSATGCRLNSSQRAAIVSRRAWRSVAVDSSLRHQRATPADNRQWLATAPQPPRSMNCQLVLLLRAAAAAASIRCKHDTDWLLLAGIVTFFHLNAGRPSILRKPDSRQTLSLLPLPAATTNQ